MQIARTGSKELYFAKQQHCAFNLVAMLTVVDLTLISGQSVSPNSHPIASVQRLAERARRALGVGRGRLFSSSGSILDGEMNLRAAKLQTGDVLTLQVGTVRIYGGSKCFTAILGDGSIVTWGDPSRRGTSSSAQHQLKNICQIQAANSAFAAIRGDGFVVTWGNASCGGDSSSAQD